MDLIQTLYPGRDHGFYVRTKEIALNLIAQILGISLKSTGGEPAPILQDRLSFCWRLLRQADAEVWKLKMADLPERTTREDARKVFHELLPVPLHDQLLTAILEGLDLEPNASYLYPYLVFRKKGWGGKGRAATRRQPLPPPLAELTGTQDPRALQRVIWWCIRARQERYITIAKDGEINVEFAYIVDRVVEELVEWYGPQIKGLAGVNVEVERQLDRWLSYSHLDELVKDDPEEAESQRQLAMLFVAHNRLETKLVVRDRSVDSHAASKIRALEAAIRRHEEEIRQQAEDIKRRDDVIEQLQASAASRSRTAPAPPDSELSAARHAGLRDFLRVVDSKYSFDSLNAVQLGEDTHLTLATFLAHMFYGLRRAGFGSYPKEDEFVLSYDDSCLYDCDGFELRPGEATGVRVVKRGWAILSRGRTFPVRRARVVRGSTTADRE
jgi:hypothetical protein